MCTLFFTSFNHTLALDVVWTEPKQIGLVDSLWKNLYVPPIILSIRNRDHEDEYRVCIDGKQRCALVSTEI
jgi:hypothetical protein